MSKQYYPPHHRALALDMAMTTGYAILDRGQVRAGCYNIPTAKKGRKTLPDDHMGKRLLDFETWVHNILSKLQPNVVFFEEAGGHYQNQSAARMAYAQWGAMVMRAAHFNIPIVGVRNTTLKKYAAGNGRAQKEDMIHAAKQKFPDVEIPDDNAADAVHILAYGMSTKYQLEVL